MIPFALKYGRRPIYLYSLAVQCAMGVLSAKLDNVGDMMGNQAIMCFVGALCEVMAQMTVADIYFVHKRGLINIMYIWTLTIGASLAPVPEGYIAQKMGWRWTWWFLAISLGVAFFVFFFFYEETWLYRITATFEGVSHYENTSSAILEARKDPQSLERFHAAEDDEAKNGGIVSVLEDAPVNEKHIDSRIRSRRTVRSWL